MNHQEIINKVWEYASRMEGQAWDDDHGTCSYAIIENGERVNACFVGMLLPEAVIEEAAHRFCSVSVLMNDKPEWFEFLDAPEESSEFLMAIQNVHDTNESWDRETGRFGDVGWMALERVAVEYGLTVPEGVPSR